MAESEFSRFRKKKLKIMKHVASFRKTAHFVESMYRLTLRDRNSNYFPVWFWKSDIMGLCAAFALEKRLQTHSESWDVSLRASPHHVSDYYSHKLANSDHICRLNIRSQKISQIICSWPRWFSPKLGPHKSDGHNMVNKIGYNLEYALLFKIPFFFSL